jgi:competence protein ComEA
MKDKLRDLFTFSSGERKGILLLVFVLILICALKSVILRNPPAPVQPKYPEWMKDTNYLEEKDQNPGTENESFAGSFSGNVESEEQRNIIDPNNASMGDLILAGFSLQVSRTIIRYREKGGRFKSADDLKKIYGLTPGIFQSVAPYIRISPLTSQSARISILPGTMNINTADSSAFEKLPGIGPVLARRITRYRTMLGGYYSPEQIREVYGITDSLFLRNKDRFEADTTHIKKLNVNTSDEKDMARHPYLGKYVAAGIIQYRKHQIKILNLNELLENGLIDKDHFDKVKFYLSL